jgi:hypothetical protein
MIAALPEAPTAGPRQWERAARPCGKLTRLPAIGTVHKARFAGERRHWSQRGTEPAKWLSREHENHAAACCRPDQIAAST